MSTSVQFTKSVCEKLNNTEANSRGIINGQIRYRESAKGGVNPQVAESTVKNFIQKIRSDRNTLNQTSVSFLDTAKQLADADCFEDVLKFYYNSKGEKVDLDNDKRNFRLNAFSNRVKKAFMDFVAVDLPKETNLDQTQMYAIVKSSCEFFTRVTQKHVPIVKVIKAKVATAKA